MRTASMIPTDLTAVFLLLTARKVRASSNSAISTAIPIYLRGIIPHENIRASRTIDIRAWKTGSFHFFKNSNVRSIKT